MTKEELLNNDELFKSFSSGAEFTDFMSAMFQRGIEKMLDGELDAHLGYDKHGKRVGSNARNGHIKKTLKSEQGSFDIRVPRDREATFEPELVPKRRNMAEGLEHVIVSLYAKGMSTRDIEEQIREVYNVHVSDSTISRVTEQVTADRTAWQNRPLEPQYLVVWMDGIVFKVREESRVINKTVYLAVGLRKDGHKEVLGLWLGKNESAAFWSTVLTDLKARGVKDICITVTDNLTGFTEAIKSIFQQATTQICVVHQIRNACKYVSYKDRKAFTAAMKPIYQAPNEEAAAAALKDFEHHWADKYAYAVKSWKDNWEELIAFLQFPVEIRKIIYTTNLIENFNGKIRKYTKNKLSFPTDEAVVKSVYLSIMEITKRWTKPCQNWPIILQQFLITFDERIEI